MDEQRLEKVEIVGLIKVGPKFGAELEAASWPRKCGSWN